MKKNVKKVIIVGILILLSILVIGGYFLIKDKTQRTKMYQEFAELGKLMNTENLTKEKLEEKTNTRVVTGRYGILENAAKTYVSDLFTITDELKTLLEDKKMSQLLTAHNYQEDGPEFVETKKYLHEIKQKLHDKKIEMFSFLEEDKINSYLEKESPNSSMKKLYQELVTKEINLSEVEKNEVDESINKVVSTLDIVEEIIDLLIENKGKWKVQDERILFDTDTLVTMYNEFIQKLRII